MYLVSWFLLFIFMLTDYSGMLKLIWLACFCEQQSKWRIFYEQMTLALIA